MLLLALGCTTVVAAEWQRAAGHRVASLALANAGKAGFTIVPESATGIGFTNHLADRSVAENQIRLVGSGVALGDVDGDGLCDIYLCRLEGNNSLYRNVGNWRFTNITGESGVACAGQYSTGTTLADIDGDGDLDLLVNSLGNGTRCFFNDGGGRFTENNSGLLQKFCATSMALADVDGNGTLDLYVANYRTTTIRSTGLQLLTVNGKRMFRPEDRDSYELTHDGLVLEHAEPDVLYQNDGKGHFTPVMWSGGQFVDADGQRLQRGDREWGLSVMMRDMNGDGAPDIYVCNDFWSADAIWLNDGLGKFRALPKLAMRNSSTFSMGVDFADINRDGLDDFLVLDMRSREHRRRMTQRAMAGAAPALSRIDDRPQTERNTLFLNRGDGTYSEIAQLAGLQASEWSWCPAFLDVDLDGFEDVLITTGHGFDTQDIDTEDRMDRGPRVPNEKVGDRILRFPRLNIPRQAFRNRGDLTFEPAGHTWGFDQVGVSHGMALGDLDGDGDLDVVVNNLNSAVGLYRNESIAPRVLVRLKGESPNTAGIGAKIRLLGGALPQSQEVVSGGRYLSSDDTVRTFAAWNVTNHFSIEVVWRNGGVSVISNVSANSSWEVQEEASVRQTTKHKIAPLSLFADASPSLAHRHHEEAFDDFARQPLLPARLSHGGPGLAWMDSDGDGWEDLVVGTGRGGEMAIFQNMNGLAFHRSTVPIVTKTPDDLTAIVGWAGKLILGQSHYESPATNRSAAAVYGFQGGGWSLAQALPPHTSSSGPLAVADADGDGDLDLFVGGRLIPGRYPEPATSRFFRNEPHGFVLAQEFSKVGLVNGAVFTDLDGDGDSELVLACEWQALKIFHNRNGVFAEADVGLGKLRGWWQGVTAADFDGDGRLDIVASNWGRNSPYETSVWEGLRIFYGDFAGSGGVDIVEAYVSEGRVVPWRDLETLSHSLPWLRQAFPTAHAFANASVSEILGRRAIVGRELLANWLDTTVFLNRGDKFEPRPLPIEAQFAPAFGINAADFDGDGSLDIFIAQNFFGTDGETSRYDAGRGLLLKGGGHGNFVAIPGHRSGLLIYGAQRGSAHGDYDGDGRVDLAVSQNSAETKLYRNQAAKPGLRVRLRGPEGNPAGVGAVVRRVSGTSRGPAHEVHAGSGYWSQDSSTMILSGAGDEIWIRWPGGRETTSRFPTNSKSLLIRSSGEVQSVR